MQEDFLLVGLGNPGPRYAKTRHNIGFMVVDKIADSINAPSWREKFSGNFTRARYKGGNLNLLKPSTFMNLSGQSVIAAMNFYRIHVDNLIIIHDELDLPFGTTRLKKGGGAGGHKGVTSVQQQLGSLNFIRLRIGIGRPEPSEEANRNDQCRSSKISSFVLDNFVQQEEKVLIEVMDRSEEIIECITRRGISTAMNEFNKRGGERDES